MNASSWLNWPGLLSVVTYHHMKLEYASVKNLKQEVKEIVGRYLDLSVYNLFFFGSRVTNRSGERADIDIGIEGPEEVPGHIMEEIKEELEELPYLYKIDIVDFRRAGSGFYREAKKNIENI